MLMLKATAKQSADRLNAMMKMDIKSVPDTNLLWHIVIDGFKNRVCEYSAKSQRHSSESWNPEVWEKGGLIPASSLQAEARE